MLTWAPITVTGRRHRLMGPRSLIDVVDVGLTGHAAADMRPGNPDRQDRREDKQQDPGHDCRPIEIQQAEVDCHPDQRP